MLERYNKWYFDGRGGRHHGMPPVSRRRNFKLSQYPISGTNLLDSSESPWDHSCHRIWSLWDIMNLFSVLQLSSHLQMLVAAQILNAGRGPLTDEQYEATVKLAKNAKEFLESIRFHDAAAKTEVSLLQLERTQRMTGVELSVEFRNIWESVFLNMDKHKFLQVSPDRLGYVDHPCLLGAKVRAAFPSASFDIREAGNCMASECNTAAVFHLMRAVEWCLRAVCVSLGFKKLKNKFKSSGRITYIPIEYSEWDKILDHCQEEVDRRLGKLKRGLHKQQLQQFYYPMLQDIRGIRDAWRNHVMHTRSEYSREDVDSILSHVKRLMVTASEKFLEV